MASDMTVDIFANYDFGKAALKKMAEKAFLSKNFRLYYGDNLGPEKGMLVRGAEFRKATNGKNKGKLSIMISGTTLQVIVTQKDIAALSDEAPPASS